MGVLLKKAEEAKKKVRWYLYHYCEIKNKIREKEEEILHNRNVDFYKVIIDNVGYYSDPTSLKALKLLDKDLEQKRKWISIIDKAIQEFGDSEKGKILQMRYLEQLGELHICRKLHVERDTYYRYKREIERFVLMLAIQYGLVKIDEEN